jgi:dynein heavy chain
VETQANDAEKIRVVVAGEEAIAQKSADEATEIKLDCEKELGEAMPILTKATQALDCITPGDISYVRALP